MIRLKKQSVVAGMALACFAAMPGSAATIDFERDIEPIFQRHCLECHGAQKKGGLRLDNRREAFMPGDSGVAVIEPRKPGESLLLQRLLSDDPEQRMPKEAPALSEAEIRLLRSWIEQGADWPAGKGDSLHWAYVKPERPELPKVDSAWPINGVDYFVYDRLGTEGLKPSKPADKARLLRRVSLDLIGLPPTMAELDAFLADDSDSAYEKVVDRLLKSPRYGERWARPWLDAARYADSNGFQADQLRDSWAYRDWVIEAMNADMPFDQFTIEQVAGDLLPDATIDQKIATGFHRTPTCNVEAGVHPEENRVNQVMDRVNTTGTVWLGTTLDCARCHNHKYDPFSMKDYYQIFAYFNNTPVEVRNPSGKGVSFDFYGPKMDLPLPDAERKRLDGLRAQLAKKEAETKAVAKEVAVELKSWEARMRKAMGTTPQWETMEIVAFESSAPEKHEVLEDGSLLLPGKSPQNAVYTVRAKTDLAKVAAIKLETLTHDKLPSKGPGRNELAGRPNFVLQELEVARAIDAGNGETLKKLSPVNPTADFFQANFKPEKLFDGKTKDRQNGWAIAGEFSKDHWVSFGLAEPIEGDAGVELVFTLTQNYGGGRTIGRMRFSAIAGEPGQFDLTPEIAAILKKGKPSRKEKKQLREHFEKSHPKLTKLRAEEADLKKRIDAIKPATTLVMVEMDEQRKTHIMKRGEYLSPGREVGMGTPDVLHPLSGNAPKNRLGFAKWLVDRENPLVARVTVNRWWAEIMGRGIVATLEDFGTQSEPPTHPKLLDWLAVEFMDKGWSMKRLHKTIVMSATYRQASCVTEELRQRDPDNRLCARGPRFRLSAEQIRDNGLAVAGLLSTKMGGEPIMPYQPPGLWRQTGRNEPKWVESPNEDRFRRGIYIVYRRAAPYPSMVNFDAPDRSSCVVKRPRTNTPLQALTLLNDPAYVEMALALANRIMNDHDAMSVEDRVRYGIRMCLAREAKKAEVDELAKVFASELELFSKDAATVKELMNSSNRWKPAKGVNQAELAAWFTVANILLNLDETVTKG
jgi:mono/diheme cytochrome c family protein